MTVSKKLFSFLVFGVFILLPQIGFSQIHFVNHAATGSNTGNGWNDAFVDLQDALAVATAGTEIWVAQGTYYPNSCSPCTAADRNVSFEIPEGVKVFGGFDGTETMASQRDWVCNLTTLSGDINNDNSPNGNAYSVVYTLRVTAATILDGFTIRGGCADLVGGVGRQIDGGGWYNDGSAGYSSNPMLRNLRFVFNKAMRGGAMFNAGAFNGEASPTYQHVEFTSNTSDSDGGACLNEGTFDGETSPQYYSCQFYSNTASGSGAGVFNNATGIKDTMGNVLYSAISNPYFVNCIFKNNTGFTTNGIGGAMYNLGSKGGNCTPAIINTLFVDNKAYAAAGMYNHGGDGGLSNPSIINCTFANNEADPFNYGGGTGGAIYNNGSLSGNASPTVLNSIFYGNIGDFDSEVFRNIDGTPFIAFSFVDKPDCAALNSGTGGNVACGNGMIYGVDPLFIDPANCDYRLQNNSVTIDAGDTSVNGEPMDLDSLARVVNSAIDMGPYENFESILPISLISFQAKYDNNSSVDLFWSAINERASGYFEVERSSNAVDFQTIERVEGSSKLNSAVTYHTKDNNPLYGKSYYRLKIVDDAGKNSYSPIRHINRFTTSVVSYPNPVIEQLILNIREEHLTGDIEYYIHTIDGREMFHKTVPMNPQIQISVDRLDPGMHSIIVLINGVEIYSQQFMVSKL